MGLLQRLKRLVPKRSSPSRIKIVHADGHAQHLDAPLSAKDLLPLHPGHGLFVAEDRLTSSRLTGLAPLHPGRVYYLRPLLPRQVSDSKLNSRARDGGKASNSDNRHGRDRHVSFASSPFYIEPAESETSVQDEDGDRPAIDGGSDAVDPSTRTSRTSAAAGMDTGTGDGHVSRVSKGKDAAMYERVKPDDHGHGYAAGNSAEKPMSTVKLVLTRRQYEQLLQGTGEDMLEAALHRPVLERCRVPRSHSSPHISAAAISV